MATAILFSIRDDKNETSTLQINVADTVSTADAIAYAETIAPLLDALLVGVIDRIGIAVNVDLTGLGLNTSPGTGADVEEGARFQFATVGGFATGHRVATFTEAKIVPGSRDVDLVDGDVAAWVNALVSGIDTAPAGGSGVVGASDARNDDIVSLKFAREQFQSSRG